jgi:hypothetical protein
VEQKKIETKKKFFAVLRVTNYAAYNPRIKVAGFIGCQPRQKNKNFFA